MKQENENKIEEITQNFQKLIEEKFKQLKTENYLYLKESGCINIFRFEQHSRSGDAL